MMGSAASTGPVQLPARSTGPPPPPGARPSTTSLRNRRHHQCALGNAPNPKRAHSSNSTEARPTLPATGPFPSTAFSTPPTTARSATRRRAQLLPHAANQSESQRNGEQELQPHDSAASQRSARARNHRRPLPHARARPAAAATRPRRNRIVQRRRPRINLSSAPHRSARRAESSDSRLDVEVDPHQRRCQPFARRLQNAELDPCSAGPHHSQRQRSTRKWSFSKSSPVQLQLNASQLDISELAKLAGQQIPVTGTLAADIKMHGSVLNPQGNGNVTL